MDSKAAAAYIITFNNLDRPQRLPGDLLNHWYFSVRDIQRPNQDIVQISHLESRRSHYTDPAPIFSLPTIEEQVTRVAILIIESFVKGLSLTLPDGELQRDPGLFAPWTWSMEDWDIAMLTGEVLRKLGVRSELCSVKFASKTEIDAAQEAWGSPRVRFQLASFGRMLEPKKRCAKCTRDSSALISQLYLCGWCRRVFYCSMTCQCTDWEEHETVCYKVGFADLVPLDYYQNIADSVEEARDLTKSLNLTIPTGQNDTVSLIVPIRRLIITGRDSPQNMQLLLGPSWENFEKEIADARIDVLLRPPPGSLSYCLNAENDEDAPTYSPRHPTQAEEQMMEKVRDIQTRITRQLGIRKEPDIHDMDEILLSFGNDCVNMMPVYRLAVTTMDIGIPYRKRNHIIPDIHFFTPLSPEDKPQSLFPCKRKGACHWPRFVHKFKTGEFLVYTDGICINEGHPDAVGGWGFVFRNTEPGHSQQGMRSGRVEDRSPTAKSCRLTSQRAQLRAVVAVLQCQNWSREGWTSLVIATTSHYVTNSVTQSVHIWGKNGWKTARDTDVHNQDLWQQLLSQVVEHRRSNLEIRFWAIPRGSNRDAESAAKEGAKKDLGEFFDDSIGETC